MSRHWKYVGVPPNDPDEVLALPQKCWDCIYRKSEEAARYCPLPNCCPEKRGENEKQQPQTEIADACDGCME